MKNKKALACVALTLALGATAAGCGKAPVPIVKEGRFHFSVTYEVDGAVDTVSSVFVCEFEESGKQLDGWYVTWNSYIEDREIEALFPEDRYNCIVLETNEDGTIYLDLCLNARYFMNEPSYAETHQCAPYLFMEFDDRLVEEKGYGTSDATVIESYGVKLIGYEYDEPIANEYKK